MRRIWMMLMIAAIGGTVAWSESGEAPVENPSENAGLMRAKLASTQKIVEGLLEKDFDLIIRGSDELLKIEAHATWPAESDQVYNHYRNEMEREVARLAQLGRDRNLDGAQYSYMHLLSTCIGCHSYCRDVLHVAKETPQLSPPPRLAPEPIENKREK
jgi:hypothetical protein